MIYDDFKILSDNEYLKIAEHYNSATKFEENEVVSILFQSVNNIINQLSLSNLSINIKIKNELNTQKNVLNKLKNNLSLLFSLKNEKSIQFNNFNIFNYLSNLANIQNIFNDWLKIDNKNKHYNFILNSKYEINNLIISLQNVLSDLNIKIFNYM